VPLRGEALTLDVPEHVTDFIATLHSADKSTRDEAQEVLLKLCKVTGYKILSSRRKAGPSTFVAVIKISDYLPNNVFVKYIRKRSVFQVYNALQQVLVSPNLMSIYGATLYWLVAEAFSFRSTGVQPKLTSTTKYILAVDALLRIHAIDIRPLMSDGFLEPPPLIDTFWKTFQVAERCATSSSDPGEWPCYLARMRRDFDTLFPAIKQPGDNDLVLHHGEYIMPNLGFVPVGIGWECRPFDWDGACISSRWHDLAYMTLPSSDVDMLRSLDPKLVRRYANGLGIFEEEWVTLLLKTYAQHRILQVLRMVAKFKKLAYTDLVGYYLDILMR